MIVKLTATLIELTEDAVVLERDGLAREVMVPPYAISELAAHRGREVTLHTLEFYESSQTGNQFVPRLLGFLHPEDKIFFARFISVKGIGPRKALRALAEPVRRVATWIESSDAAALSRLPGIGKRSADLIIAELRGKLKDLAIGDSGDAREAVGQWSQAQRDALEVLVQWGDPRADAERLIERAAQLHPDLTQPDEWVRLAYRIKSGVEG